MSDHDEDEPETLECSHCGEEWEDGNEQPCLCEECGADCADLCRCSDCDSCSEHHSTCDYCESCLESMYHETCYTCDMCLEDPDHEYCEYCQDCKQSCGGCNSGMGHSKRTPWERRGISVQATGYHSWDEVYPTLSEKYGQTDPLMAAATFYVLEAMSAGAMHPVPGVTSHPIGGPADQRFVEMLELDQKQAAAMVKVRDKRVDERRVSDPEFNLAYLMGKAENLLDEHVENLDAILIDYFHLACGGELRHHLAVGDKVLSNDRSRAWGGWKKVFEKIGVEALDDMAELFEEFEGDGYGGPLWADAARILAQRLRGELGPDERINKRMFVDRVWTLEHNGGCFLNKLPWAIKNSKKWHFDRYMKKLLNWHASDPPRFRALLTFCEPHVKSLYEEYHAAAVEVLMSRGVAAPESHFEAGAGLIVGCCTPCPCSGLELHMTPFGSWTCSNCA